jgi:hypothetical protein
VALLAAVPFALAACDMRQAGSAAVVGDTRISETSIDHAARSAVDTLNKAGVEAPQTADLLRAQIELQVDDAIVAAAQERQHIVVTQGEIDDLIAKSGGRAALEQQLVQQSGLWLPPSELDALARTALIQQALGPKLVPGGTSDQQTAAVNDYLIKLANELGVSVSPRYGAWDPSTLKINASFDDLSRAAGTAPASTASPSPSPSASGS